MLQLAHLIPSFDGHSESFAWVHGFCSVSHSILVQVHCHLVTEVVVVHDESNVHTITLASRWHVRLTNTVTVDVKLPMASLRYLL